jgi:ribosomal protein S18 acetylase RimI-like enzyme
MANFYTSLSAQETAGQIATLLNANNKLTVRHTTNSILSSGASYFVDIMAGKVVGCDAIIKINELFTRQFHLCVHPEFRRRGIARKLKEAALRNVTTPYVYVTIREDNKASIGLNLKMGFIPVRRTWASDHYVVMLCKLMTNRRVKSNVYK